MLREGRIATAVQAGLSEREQPLADGRKGWERSAPNEVREEAGGRWAAAGSTPFANPQQLEITVIIEQLHDVAEMDFTFTVQFRLMMSWYDTSVFLACNGADPWADDPVECPEVWRPEVAFLNLREIEWIGKSEFYAMPAGWDAEMGGTGTGPCCS